MFNRTHNTKLYTRLSSRNTGKKRTFIFFPYRSAKPIYNPQIEMFARFKMKSSFHKTKRII